ncbi:MAG: helix-turn-helix domain-containing protein, partial [Emergencia timonensis]
DYKKTCQTMFVHENTIRYRINKIKALIPYGKSDMDFYETISVAVKIYKMKNF